MASPEALDLNFFHLENPTEDILELKKALTVHLLLPCSKCGNPAPCSFYWMGAGAPGKSAIKNEEYSVNTPPASIQKRTDCSSTAPSENCYSAVKSEPEVELNNGGLEIETKQVQDDDKNHIKRVTSHPPGLQYPPLTSSGQQWGPQTQVIASPSNPVHTTSNGMFQNWTMSRTEAQPYQQQIPHIAYHPYMFPFVMQQPHLATGQTAIPNMQAAMAQSTQEAYLSQAAILQNASLVAASLGPSAYVNPAAYMPQQPSLVEARMGSNTAGVETPKTRTTPVVSLRDTQPVDASTEMPVHIQSDVVSEQCVEDVKVVDNASMPWSDIPVEEDSVEIKQECHDEEPETIEVPVDDSEVKSPEVLPSIISENDVEKRPCPEEQPETVTPPKEDKAEPPAVAAAPSAWTRNISWSNVFSENQKQTPKTTPVQSQSNTNINKDNDADAVKDVDPRLVQLSETLQTYKVEFDSASYQPRGLMNKSNWCYVNSALQALLACSPLYNLLRKLPKMMHRDDGTKTPTPIIDTMISFYSNFDKVKRPPKNKDGSPCDISPGQPFEPSVVYDMLAALKSNTYKVEGRQEDAEEFLSHVLNGLHDEMIEIQKVSSKKANLVITNGDVDDGDSDEGWQVQTNRRAKTCVARNLVSPTETPVSEIFRGKYRAVLTTPSGQPTATLTPFYSLQLDIKGEGVVTLQSALQNLTSKETIEDFTCSKTRQEVTANRQIFLEELPPILILHLKRFVYDATTGDSNKLMTRVEPSIILNINKDLLSPDTKRKIGSKPIKYRLFGVIYHSGQEMNKGHYITDVFHSGYRQWIRFNDAEVKAITENTVLKHNPPSVPYILVYKKEEGAQRTSK